MEVPPFVIPSSLLLSCKANWIYTIWANQCRILWGLAPRGYAYLEILFVFPFFFYICLVTDVDAVCMCVRVFQLWDIFVCVHSNRAPFPHVWAHCDVHKHCVCSNCELPLACIHSIARSLHARVQPCVQLFTLSLSPPPPFSLSVVDCSGKAPKKKKKKPAPDGEEAMSISSTLGTVQCSIAAKLHVHVSKASWRRINVCPVVENLCPRNVEIYIDTNCSCAQIWHATVWMIFVLAVPNLKVRCCSSNRML